MGWWGCGVVDGDSACDLICEIEDACGIDNDDEIEWNGYGSEDKFYARKQRADRKKFKRLPMTEKLELASEGDLWEFEGFGLQVLGYMYLYHNCSMSSKLKEMVLSAIDNELCDGWNDSDNRKTEMAIFRECVVKGSLSGLTLNGLFYTSTFK